MMLRVEGLSKSFGGRTLMDRVNLHLHPEDRVGLVGRNGEGKTTLLRMLAGIEPHDDGRIVLRSGSRVGYLRQEMDPTSERVVIDEVRTVFEPLHALEERMRELEREIAATRGEVHDALASRYDAVRHEFEHRGGFEAETLLLRTLTGLGIDEEKREKPLRTQSGGWLMRVELAKLLLARPEVLLLDEPTNHLDLPSIRWFEGVLASYPGAVIVVSHDRTFLDRHANRIVELEHARVTSYTGNYTAYEQLRASRRAEAEARMRNLDRQIAHARTFVERFGAKASKASQANSRKRLIEKLGAERATLVPERDRRGLRFRFKPVHRSGEIVLRMERVAKAYGDLVVFDSLDLEIRRGERIAMIGPNGAGKSTLLRLAAGHLTPDSGTRELGHNVAVAFYAQHQLEALSGERTVLEEIEANAPLDEIPRLRTLLGAFLFSGDDVGKRVRVLSGGEKARLALAKLLLGGANFLVLDEPTTHLDIQAREMLTHALAAFNGTLILISHDRSFINALANRVLEVTPRLGGSRIFVTHGNFDDYERSLEGEAARPEGRRTGGKKKPISDEAAAQRERRRELRRLRAEFDRTEAAIESSEARWQELDAETAKPEASRDGARMRAITHERRGLEQDLAELNRRWEDLGAEIEEIEAVDGPGAAEIQRPPTS